jgi:hypothetical protein
VTKKRVAVAEAREQFWNPEERKRQPLEAFTKQRIENMD